MVSSLRRLSFAAVLFSSLALANAALAASPTAADRDTARALMTQGTQLRDKGDSKGALESFRAADAIMHVPSTGIEVAKTEASLGQLVEALDVALAVARLPEQANEPKPFAVARKDAQALATDLEGRIPSLQITLKNVPEGSTPAVDVDGVAIAAAALSFPRKVNPGHHVVSASAGSSRAKSEIDIAERETKGVLLELAPDETTVVAPKATPVEAPKPVSADATPKKFPVLAAVGFGVGVAGVAVGAVTGLMSLSKTSSLKEQCPNDQCPSTTFNSDQFQSDKSSASTLGTVSTIAFIVGGVGVAVGVVGLVLPHKTASVVKTGSATKPTVSPWIAPTLGGSAAGLVGTF